MRAREIESEYTAEQIGLLYYFGRKDEFEQDERLAKMTAVKVADGLAELLAPLFGGVVA